MRIKGMKLTSAAARSRAMARTAPAAYPRCWVDNGTRKDPNGDRDTRETAGREYDETRRSP